MKILYCNGFSDDEIFNYKTILVQNLLLGIRDLINLCSEDRSIDLDKHKKVSSLIFCFCLIMKKKISHNYFFSS